MTSRRCPCLERFAAPRDVGTISGCLPQSPQDAPLQALLSIFPFHCCACEVTLVTVGHINCFFTRVAPDIISGPGPGRNPAVFFQIRLNPAPAGYDRRIWGRIYQILKIRTSLLSGLFFLFFFAKTKSSHLYLTINIHHYLTFNNYFNIVQYRHVDELTLTMTYYKNRAKFI